MDSAPPLLELDLDNLKALKILGKGAMGTVFLVRHPTITTTNTTTTNNNNNNLFALKVVDKTSMHAKLDAERRARWEIQVLSALSHPFLPSILGIYESPQFLAWALPYCPGGDLNVLRYHQNDRVFSPTVIRFYLAEIICALDHLHSMGIAYRDLKPENVLIQRSGHVTLTDFDLSRKLKHKTVNNIVSAMSLPDKKAQEASRKHRRNFSRWIQLLPKESSQYYQNGLSLSLSLKKTMSARVSPVSRRKQSFSNGERSNSFVGTEEYVSPEVVHGDGHEFAVDWWALGILTYEMLYGRTPFKGKNRKETFRNVLTKSPEFVGKRTELTNLIERLLEKDPMKRLGYSRGAIEVKQHGFFRGVNWEMLTKVVRPPFIPGRDDINGELPSGKFSDGNGSVNIKDYFQRLKSSSLMPHTPLPLPSPPCYRFRKNVSLTAF